MSSLLLDPFVSFRAAAGSVTLSVGVASLSLTSSTPTGVVPPTLQLGQEFMEIIYSPSGILRLGQEFGEIVYVPRGNLQVGQEFVEVIYVP